MPVDWTNFTPNKIPKNKTTVENADVSVPEDRELFLGIKPIPLGPGKVFKGYPTTFNPVFAKGRNMPTDVRPVVTVCTTDVQEVGIHGVADPEQVESVLYPQDQSLLDSLVKQEALLVTKDLKIVNISEYAWPIDLQSAQDVRRPSTLVKYGDEVGVIASINQELATFQSDQSMCVVPVQDLEPVIVRGDS